MPTFFATTAKGMEELLAEELRELGARDVRTGRAGVSFEGALDIAYRACLWSRIANRVLMPLSSFSARSPQELYEEVRSIHWSDHLGPRRTLAVDFSASHSKITHSHFGALKTKDAIVDQLRDQTGARPSVEVAQPSVRINVYLHEDRATVSIDLSGESLHRRHYRQAGGTAPLKENLAAAVLRLAGWPHLAQSRTPLLDPMCGSGTLPIEAGLIAADIAPGRGRSYFGFLGWRGHEPQVWSQLIAEAEEREIRDPKRLPPIRGYDSDVRAVRAALANVEHAGLRGRVHIEKLALHDCTPIASRARGDIRGILVANPPYGRRLGEAGSLTGLYAELGDILRRRFMGWTAYILTGNPALGRSIGLRTARKHILYNGPVECRLLVLPISAEPVRDHRGPHWRGRGKAGPD